MTDARATSAGNDAQFAIDPVCGMQVDTRVSTLKHVHAGATYHFCAPGCKKRFDREPMKYIAEVG